VVFSIAGIIITGTIITSAAGAAAAGAGAAAAAAAAAAATTNNTHLQPKISSKLMLPSFCHLPKKAGTRCVNFFYLAVLSVVLVCCSLLPHTASCCPRHCSVPELDE
jgi:hypothetical protein